MDATNENIRWRGVDKKLTYRTKGKVHVLQNIMVRRGAPQEEIEALPALLAMTKQLFNAGQISKAEARFRILTYIHGQTK